MTNDDRSGLTRHIEPSAVTVLDATDLESLSTEELRRELSTALDLTAHTLRRVASIIRILEDRGEDLSDLRLGFFAPYLRQIAHGQVLAELVSRFAANRLLLQRATALPLPDQRKLAEGEPVVLVVRGPDGRIDTRMADPVKMSRDQLAQVFSPTGIRDQAEQILILEERDADRAGKKPGKRQISLGRITADCRQGVLRVGRTALDPATVVEGLAALAADCEPESENYTEQVAAAVTLAQYEAINAAAARGQTTVSALIRRALGAYGLFSRR